MTPISELFKGTPDEAPLFRNTNFRKRREGITFNLHPLAQLPALLTKLKAKSDPDERYTMRFIVDSNYQAWFAEEGHSKTIPNHGEMTGDPCLAAGNITFSEDFTTIIRINHKSGDLKPTFDSLQWLLAVLILNNSTLTTLSLSLAENLHLEPLTEGGGSVMDSDEHAILHSVNKIELTEWVLKTFSESLQEKIKRQPDPINTITYGSPKREREEAHQGPRKRSPLSAGKLLFLPPPLPRLLTNDDEESTTLGRVI